MSVNNHSSDLKSINVDVPQGSILGPLLFLIYINELPLSSAISKFVLFADDTGIVIKGKILNMSLKLLTMSLFLSQSGMPIINLF